VSSNRIDIFGQHLTTDGREAKLKGFFLSNS
jgi:hypothetical protein